MLEVIKAVRPRWVIGENVTGIVNMALDTVLSDLEDQGYATQAFIVPACAQNAPHRRDRVWIVGRAEEQPNANPKNGDDRRDSRKMDGTKERQEELWPVTSNVCQDDVAHPQGWQNNGRKGRDLAEAEGQGGCINPTSDPGCEDVGNSKSTGFTGGINRQGKEQFRGTSPRNRECENRLPQPHLCRVASRLSQKLDCNQWDNGEWEGVPRVAVGVKDRVNRLKALGNAIVPQIVIPIMQAIKALEV